jgi:hypothetical protein
MTAELAVDAAPVTEPGPARHEAHRLAVALRRLDEHRKKCKELRDQLETLHVAVTGESERLEQLENLVREADLAIAQLAAEDAAHDAGRILDNLKILEAAVGDPRWDSTARLDTTLKRYHSLEDEQRKSDTERLEALARQVASYREALDRARSVLAPIRAAEKKCTELEAVVAQVRRALADKDQYEVVLAGLAKLEADGLESRIAQVGADIGDAKEHWQLAELTVIRAPGHLQQYEVILRMPGEAGGHGLSIQATSHAPADIVDRLCERARALEDTVASSHGETRDSRDAGRGAAPEIDGIAAAKSIGEELYDLVIPRNIKNYLEHVRCSLTISTNDLDLPLELLHLGDELSFLSLHRPISRMPLGTSAERSYRTPRRSSRRPNLRFLLIGANGRNDLPSVPGEIKRIRDELTRAFDDTVEVDVPPATRQSLYDAIRSGNYHVIHFAGHGEYNPDEPARSSLVLDDGVLPAGTIENNLQGNPVVFLNGCKTTAAARSGRNSVAPAEGLSASFIYGGALGCIGNAWPVHDSVAAEFAVSFYKHLIAGDTLGKAMLRARGEMFGHHRTRLTWAGFVLFGNPLFRMNWNPERPPDP